MKRKTNHTFFILVQIGCYYTIVKVSNIKSIPVYFYSLKEFKQKNRTDTEY